VSRRHYSSAAADTTLSSTITSGATSITVGSITGHPVQFPYTLILDPETPTEEVIEVTAGTGTNLTVTRGVDGTTGLAHTAGAVVRHGVSARDYDEPNAHVNASTGVHGVTGSVVGTSDTQTLTSKTIDLTDNTVVGTLAEFSAAVSDADLVGVATTQTLTNKTLTAPTITAPVVTGGLSLTGKLAATSDLQLSNCGIYMPGTSAAASHSGQTLFVESGALKWKSASGTVTTIVPNN
jgi:hypothetical protein